MTVIHFWNDCLILYLCFTCSEKYGDDNRIIWWMCFKRILELGDVSISKVFEVQT